MEFVSEKEGSKTKQFQTFSIILPNFIHKSKKRDLNSWPPTTYNLEWIDYFVGRSQIGSVDPRRPVRFAERGSSLRQSAPDLLNSSACDGFIP